MNSLVPSAVAFATLFLARECASTAEHFYIIDRYTMPASQDVTIPYNITGPAIVKIFAPTPKTKPSDLNSIAGAATLFANPVIGTRQPAPPTFAIFG